MDKVRIGVIGCGMISDIYLTNMKEKFAEIIDVCGCADMVPEKAQAQADKYGIRLMTTEELLQADDIDLVLNLTIPAAHAQVSKSALLNGKSVYSEKPLAINVEDAEDLIALAKEKRLYIGCAPDTFLGGGLQTVKKLLDEGLIGEPISCNVSMLSRGPESFHPHPEFFYLEGGGPMLDMGPYYITAMAALFGPVKRVAGMGKSTYKNRIITGKSRTGEQFPSYVDTHISGLLEFENKVIANLTMSWDMQYSYWESKLPLMEVFGSEGTIIVPDPNTFGGVSDMPFAEPGTKVLVRKGSGEFEEYPVEFGYIENSRGLGVADMAYAMKRGASHRATGDLALHVVEVLKGVLTSGKNDRFIEIKNSCRQPQPFPASGPEFK